MTMEIANDGVTIPAETLASYFGLSPADMLGLMREGAITSRLEKGNDEDAGRYRLTFWHAGQWLRLTCDVGGNIVGVTRTTLSDRTQRPR